MVRNHCYANKDHKRLYFGEVKGGKPDGAGARIFYGKAYPYIIEGWFYDGLSKGQGRMVAANGNCYIGNFYFGEFNREGTFRWANGDVYAGTWNMGKREGEGIFRWTDGDSFVGTFHQDLRHGKGTFLLANGDSISGNYEMGNAVGEHLVRECRLTYKVSAHQKEGKKKEQTLEDYVLSALKLM